MIRLVSAWVLVNAMLLAPQWVFGVVADAPISVWVALEAALIVGLSALLPRHPLNRALVWAVALGIVLVTVVSFADLVFRVSLARPLNLFLDLYLMSSVYELAVGNAGYERTLIAVAGAVMAAAVVASGLAWLLGPPRAREGRANGGPSGRGSSGHGPPGSSHVSRLGGLAMLAFFALGLTLEASPHVATPMFQIVREQAHQLQATRRERESFATALASSPRGYADTPGLFAKLQGADVLLTFIESYGMAALEDPEFAAVIRSRLDTLGERATRAGFHVATGTLNSPTRGGQSWYAHGTFISGLWLENQLRYELLIASDRETLVDDFRRAGYRSLAIMPAITTAWPEGVRLGYDEVYTSANIPYAGPPIYWVTMPDQFTWSFLGRTMDADRSGRPLFVEAAMVSSHAPWTPVVPMLPWESIGDGAVFAPFRQDGHPPEELWIDTDQLRRDYARSLDYSLAATTDFAERFVDGETLLIVIGDHQAAPWVTGAASAAVPVHVLSRDADLVEPFLRWGFRPGPIPDSNRTPPGMDEFRHWFVRAFSDPPLADLPASRGES